MTDKNFKKIRILTTSFISVTVAMAIVHNNTVLALAGVLIGILFLFLVKKTTKKVLVDERILQISEKASRMTFVILTITLAILSILFIGSGNRTGEPYMEMLGIIFSYTTMLSLAIYSISYKFLEKKYGGDE